MKTLSNACCVGALLCAAWSIPALAGERVTFHLSGVVDVRSDLEGAPLGAPLEIFYSFDPDGAPLYSDATRAAWDECVVPDASPGVCSAVGGEALFVFGDVTYTSTTFYRIEVNDERPASDCPAQVIDQIQLTNGFGTGVEATFQLISCDPGFVTGLQLPETPPDLSLADRTNFARLGFETCEIPEGEDAWICEWDPRECCTFHYAQGTITSFEVHVSDPVARACPCDGDWKSHGQYVKCVAHAIKELGLQGRAEGSAVVSAAAQTECGK